MDPLEEYSVEAHKGDNNACQSLNISYLMRYMCILLMNKILFQAGSEMLQAVTNITGVIYI